MARGKKETGKELTIAIVGAGVKPRNVTLRQLAALLEATASAFDSIAMERNLESPQLSLTRVKNGSAAYVLRSDDVQAPRAFNSFVSTVRQRGKNASPRTRASLTRLHSVVAKSGASLRIDPATATPNAKPLFLAAPLEDEAPSVEEGTLIFGRVVGVKLDAREKASVTLRYDDGGSGEFDADVDLLERAARVMGRNVAARVTFFRGVPNDYEGSLESLEERQATGEITTAFANARALLVAEGIEISAKEWLAGMRDDE